MRKLFFLLIAGITITLSAQAQQHIDPKGMNYLTPVQPNNILYHDTVFSGVRQFKDLFYRTGDEQIIRLLKKHQSNKIFGQLLGLAGTVTMIFGIDGISPAHTNKGLGWELIGGGFAMSLTGGYLSMMGRQNLQLAVVLFNQKYHQASLGIGVADHTAGLVYKF